MPAGTRLPPILPQRIVVARGAQRGTYIIDTGFGGRARITHNRGCNVKTILFRTVAAAALILFAGAGFAQTAPKTTGGDGSRAAPAGTMGASPGGADELKPRGQAAPGQPGAKAIPGATGGGASPGMKPSATDQAEPAPGARKAGENAGVEPERKPEDGKQRPAEVKPGAETGAASKPDQKGGAGHPAPQVTQGQRTRIQESFRHLDVHPVSVDFKIGIGVAVPRTVVIAPLPPEIIGVVPDYDGFRYFVVPGEIVIVDPVSLEVVAVLPL